jgi:hypothetical protein
MQRQGKAKSNGKSPKKQSKAQQYKVSAVTFSMSLESHFKKRQHRQQQRPKQKQSQAKANKVKQDF